MATRFYFMGNTTIDGINPVNGGWDTVPSLSPENSYPTRLGLGSLSGSTLTSTLATPGANSNIGIIELLSPPLIAATTISGTVKGIAYMKESVATADECPQILIRVLSNDGNTTRGILYDFDNSALSNELDPTTLTSRKIPRNWSGSGATLTSVSAQAGDRICVDLGFRTFGVGVNQFGSVVVGVVSTTTDAPENETDTSSGTKNGWIEFSQDLFFAPTPRVPEASPSQAVTGSTTSKTSGTTIAITTNNSQPQVGDVHMIAFASDPASGTYSCADSAGNSYSIVKTQTNGSGTSGVQSILFASLITTALTSASTVTVTHPTLTARAIIGTAVMFLKSATAEAVNGGNASASPSSAGNITPAANLEFVFGVDGMEATSADFSGAPTNYHRVGATGTTGGGAASNISVVSNWWTQLTATTTDHPQALGASRNTADIVAAFTGILPPPVAIPYDRQPMWSPMVAQ